MGKIAEAYVDIGANTTGLDAGLAKSRSNLQGFVGFAGNVLSGLAVAGAVAGAAAAGIGTQFFAAAKKAADLGETVSKVQFVFGKSASVVSEMSDSMAANFGAIKQETLDAAAAFGLMGQAAGQSKEESARLGAEFVKLGLDAASFFNVSNEEAFMVLRSGLAGETEPLRRFGVLLSQDALEAEALALGLVKVKTQLTEQQKVTARVSLIRKGLAPATGDLERTSSSTANQLRKLQGDFDNAVTEFGKDLQEPLLEGLKLAREIAETIRKATGAETAGKGIAETITAGMHLGEVGLGTNGASAGKFALGYLQRALAQTAGFKGTGGERTMEREIEKAAGHQAGAATAAEIRARVEAAAKSKKVQADEGLTGPLTPGQVTKRTLEQARKEALEAAGGVKVAPHDYWAQYMTRLERTNPFEHGRLQAAEEDEKAAVTKKNKQAQNARNIKDTVDHTKTTFSGIFTAIKEKAEETGALIQQSVSGDKVTAKGSLRALAGGVLGGGGLGNIALGLLGAVEKGREHVEARKDNRSEVFSGEDYARAGIQAALNQLDIPKQQLAVQKGAKETADKLLEAFNKFVVERRASNRRGVFPQ